MLERVAFVYGLRPDVFVICLLWHMVHSRGGRLFRLRGRWGRKGCTLHGDGSEEVGRVVTACLAGGPRVGSFGLPPTPPSAADAAYTLPT